MVSLRTFVDSNSQSMLRSDDVNYHLFCEVRGL